MVNTASLTAILILSHCPAPLRIEWSANHSLAGIAALVMGILLIYWIPGRPDFNALQTNVNILLKANGLAVIAVSDEEEFAKSLPALNEIIKKPVNEVKPTNSSLQLIANKLQKVPKESPEYWPTLLRFIQFASQANPSSKAPPPGKPQISVREYTLSAYPGEKITLDGLRILVDGGKLQDLTIRNSRIIFTGNPATLVNVRFVDCVFEMPDVKTPNPYLKTSAEQLLASQFTEIKDAG
jgi:hypothetical protein